MREGIVVKGRSVELRGKATCNALFEALTGVPLPQQADPTDGTDLADRTHQGRAARLERAAAAHGATAEDVADRQVEAPSVRDLVDPFLNAGDC